MKLQGAVILKGHELFKLEHYNSRAAQWCQMSQYEVRHIHAINTEITVQEERNRETNRISGEEIRIRYININQGRTDRQILQSSKLHVYKAHALPIQLQIWTVQVFTNKHETNIDNSSAMGTNWHLETSDKTSRGASL